MRCTMKTDTCSLGYLRLPPVARPRVEPMVELPMVLPPLSVDAAMELAADAVLTSSSIGDMRKPVRWPHEAQKRPPGSRLPQLAHSIQLNGPTSCSNSTARPAFACRAGDKRASLLRMACGSQPANTPWATDEHPHPQLQPHTPQPQPLARWVRSALAHLGTGLRVRGRRRAGHATFRDGDQRCQPVGVVQ